ncbi:GlxA family transcriptional regulator [Pseudonocardia spinosispora]|uniref:GlxA family transcriptional regulator n=1 Tax=Pseudonocardia spinosispora TaxID=103441 RepID=UPI0004027027|nr:helix-turn-helix domain-containing protein [Pseudonocardia spinosispora]
MSRHLVALAVTAKMSIFELAVPCEVFGYDRPNLTETWYDFRLCAAQGEPVVVQGGFRPDTAFGLGTLTEADTVIVAAGHQPDLEPDDELVASVRAAYDNGARIVSLCTGAFVLAEAGILDGRPAATHWMHADDLAARYPKVRVDSSVLYIDDGNVLTSAGTAAALDLCLYIVRSDHGAAVANALAKRMVTPAHRLGGQAQYIDAAVGVSDTDALGPVLHWALERLDTPLTVAALARRAQLTERTLVRRFHAATGTTPMKWLQAQRLNRARELLETDDRSIEWVADVSGMGSSANFRQVFRTSTGLSPSAYRRAFRQR